MFRHTTWCQTTLCSTDN